MANAVGRFSITRLISCLMSWRVIVSSGRHGLPTASRALGLVSFLFSPNHITAVSPELKDWFVDQGVAGHESRHGPSRH